MNFMPTSPLNAKTKKGLRVLLDSTAENHLQEMEAALMREKDFIKINPSRLSSWIITHFYQHHFVQQTQAIAKAHFNSKEYLRQLVTKIKDEDDATEKLSEALRGLQGNKTVRTRSNKIPKLIKNEPD